ncbi:MAG: diguanylate cyclase [Chloroflexi bacterium]|nr:diguanylate cyclase [Chloroflexota bacterium]
MLRTSLPNVLSLRRWSIRAKVLAALVALLLLAVGLVLYVSATAVQATLLAEHAESARAVLNAVETLFPEATDLRGPLAQQRLAAIAQGRPDIRRLAIVVPEEGRWRVVAGSREEDLWQAMDLGAPAGPLAAPVVLPVPGSGDQVHYFLAALSSKGLPGAALLLETDTGDVRRALEDMLGRTVQIAVISILVLVGVFFWELELLLLRPIRQLHWLAGELERGALHVRSGVRRGDEVGHLASALDQMAAGLERAAEENRRLYAELERRWEAASRDAITDFLTGLYNHRYLQLRLQEELAQAARQHHPLSLLLLDIDHFKALNDACGHLVGDQVLAELASVIRASVRAMDIPCRYGGEEFAILLPGTGAQQALIVAERIRLSLASHSFRLFAEEWSRVTVSIGVATAPEDAQERDALVKAADDALYYAKRMGRNQVWAYRDLVVDPCAASRPDWWEQLQLNTVQSLAAAVDARDSYTHDHGDQVARLSVFLGQLLGLSASDLRALMLAGTVHDVGKIGVPDRILRKPGPLTDDEWTSMRSHSNVGDHILQQVRGLEEIAPLIRAHHERWDGCGYPDGLRGEAIPRLARVLSVADAFHAMTSDRPYRQAMPVATSLEELRRGAGVQFDPSVVEVFCQAVERGELGTSNGTGGEGGRHVAAIAP